MGIHDVLIDSTQGFGMGGIESWIRELCIGLAGKKDVSVLTDTGKQIITKNETVQLETLPIEHELEWGANNFMLIYRYLLENAAGTMIINGLNSFMFASVLLHRRAPERFKIISVIHQGEEDYYTVNSIIDKDIAAFVCVSIDIAEELRIRGVEEEKCKCMNCPVYIPRKLVRNYTTNSNLPIVIGYAGRMVVRKKRIDLFIGLISELERLRVNYLFKFAGYGKDEAILLEQVKLKMFD